MPQQTFSGIIGAGQVDLAVASKGNIVLEGAWLWELKDWIDRKWMAGYSHDLPIMEMEAPPTPEVAAHSRRRRTCRAGACLDAVRWMRCKGGSDRAVQRDEQVERACG